MDMAANAAGSEPLLKLLPIKSKKYAIITTGNEIFHGRIKDTFSPVVSEKMAEYSCEQVYCKTSDDNPAHITDAIREALDAGAEIVLCTGGMSVDPDDRTPLAIKSSGAAIVSYGAPMLPGAMFLVSYMPDGRAVCGLPGCVMYSRKTIFDLVLPRLLADVPVTPKWLSDLGNGGLCLACHECHFPNCGFCKGV
jgi:molybdenum cofactor synthesis domain-containing protein